MRSIGFIVLVAMLTMFSTSVWAQFGDESPGDDDPTSAFENNEAPKQEAQPAASSGSSSDMVVDAEMVERKTDSSGRLVDADFVSLGGTAAWLERNGLGLHLGLGGYTCGREYCNTTLDVNMLGSIAGIIGAYWRFNPNWSLYGDVTFAHINTNVRDTVGSGDNSGFAFQFIVGAAFHLPVRGWLDLYVNAGLGPALLRVKVDEIGTDVQHNWGGIDIEMGLGADFYFWSVGTLKNFSIGPFMKFGLPIWIKACEVTDQENCGRPSELAEQFEQRDVFWDETPIMFQVGLEAKLEFSIGGKEDKPKPAEGAKKKDPKKAEPKAGSDEDAVNDATAPAPAAEPEADAEASGDANWDM